MKKIIIKSLVILALIIPSYTFAVSIVPNYSFGGRVVGIYECACEASLLITVADMRAGIPILLPLVFSPVSTLHMDFSFMIGGQAAGTAVPVGVCSMGSTACTPIPVAGTITGTPLLLSGVGTSFR
jgi:hypothetical protein